MKTLWYTVAFLLGLFGLLGLAEGVTQLLDRDISFLQLPFSILLGFVGLLCFRKARSTCAGAIVPPSEKNPMLCGALLASVLGIFAVLFFLAHGRSLRISRMNSARSQLKQAYSEFITSGAVKSNGAEGPFVFTNIVVADGGTHQCAVGMAVAPFETEGILTLSTNAVFIWLDHRHGSRIIPSSGYVPPLFPGRF